MGLTKSSNEQRTKDRERKRKQRALTEAEEDEKKRVLEAKKRVREAKKRVQDRDRLRRKRGTMSDNPFGSPVPCRCFKADGVAS